MYLFIHSIYAYTQYMKYNMKLILVLIPKYKIIIINLLLPLLLKQPKLNLYTGIQNLIIRKKNLSALIHTWLIIHLPGQIMLPKSTTQRG